MAKLDRVFGGGGDLKKGDLQVMAECHTSLLALWLLKPMILPLGKKPWTYV